ncbi:MAG: hypothetical protein UT24_C0003G0058 [Candidatus Woesebacteria bacterium GW2011_GWB1_39_12]|uniref:Uncharacterized protein n=1 Tax=Candidatus Woesebacteria bacterium GW2011_GWB1_39_12 TaxID=1618574 RepID=A0A0G0MML6_9BACT|nr:MAG: hypothetical protein UT24_C0003G0058 [Candidatus Woesebacteria bacterium GW2011_GWB1_39_12]
MTDKKKKPRTYSSGNRQLAFRRLVFGTLIRTRLLEGLTWEELPKKIADTLNVQVSRGRGIRSKLVEWSWIKFTPSKVEITDVSFREFEAS